jgi:L-asparaginase
VRLAAARAARGIGVVIAMGGRIDAAREATKVHTRALRAFGSFGYGALGEVAGDEVRLYRRTLRRTAFPDALLEPRVVLVRLVAGMDGLFLEAARRAGARGIVLEAFGIGDVTPAVATEAARCVAEGIAVLVVSRCPSGGVAPLYGGAGGGASLARAGVLFGGTLHGPKARILLMLALGAVQRSGRSLEEWLEPHLNL